MINLLFSIIPLIPCFITTYTLYINESKVINKILISYFIGFIGFIVVNNLIPVVSEYTLKRGLSGKDLGKKGTSLESKDVPEALGIVSGVVFLMCAILSQLLFAQDANQLIVSNSSLFAICFMIFLGFTDDTLDLKWRYKLILPTIASLPLLSTYSGSTALYVPEPLRFLFFQNNNLTMIGFIIDKFITVDIKASGAIIELGYFFKVFMGCLAVFCTNAINILAGINGLECGQSYVISCSILFFKLYEISKGDINENQMFSVLFIIPFIGTSLGLLRHNWFPASVFVGDTYCYFAGMTFAVIGIHGHFSKTLLLLFLPQVINFIYSIPQLFKFVPCPRHRLPKVDPSTKLLNYSVFPCKDNEYKLFKVNSNDTECPNLTIICIVLRIVGPTSEKNLTLLMLTIQIMSSVLAFYLRYVILENS